MSSLSYKLEMRPLQHPSVGDITVEGILYALSDPIRVQIFANIASSECARTCSNFLMLDNRKLPKSTLSQHFKILRESGIVFTRKEGTQHINILRREDLEVLFPGLLDAILKAAQPLPVSPASTKQTASRI